MDFFSTYPLLIEASIILILSFSFGEISKKTSIPSVLLLIILGAVVNLIMNALKFPAFDFFPILQTLGTVGLIMIVLEAALELKLDKEKIIPISIALGIALVGLLLSTWVTAMILQYFIEGMDSLHAWIYATPLSILSSAIIIPSVSNLRSDKKEFHIYESTFSDILGIMVFYFLLGKLPHGGENPGPGLLAQQPSAHEAVTDSLGRVITQIPEQVQAAAEHSSGGSFLNFALTTVLTIVLSIVFSYLIVFIFQRIKSSAKLFLLISVLLLLYSIGKLAHLSPLFIILIFGLVISNMDLFFRGPLKKWLDKKEAKEIYHGLHLVTLETAFVVRTFFFVIFGITIVFSSLADWEVIGVSALCLVSIYIIRFVILRLSIGSDIKPQLYIAPRGLITVLLFYAIPAEAQVEGFSLGILLFIIIGTSLVMTWAMIVDKRRAGKALGRAKANFVGETKWKAPEIN
jgi:NhaP-type Na+/H+ or K+/H+ antiporter